MIINLNNDYSHYDFLVDLVDFLQLPNNCVDRILNEKWVQTGNLSTIIKNLESLELKLFGNTNLFLYPKEYNMKASKFEIKTLESFLSFLDNQERIYFTSTKLMDVINDYEFVKSVNPFSRILPAKIDISSLKSGLIKDLNLSL